MMFLVIMIKGLSPDQYVRGLVLFVYVLKEQKYINDFGKTQEDIIKLVTEDGFELDWLINRWNSIIEDKSVKIVVLFHLLMMEELNSETMILLLSVLISNCNFVIVRSVKIVLLIFIIVQVLYVIFDLVLIILLLLIVKLVIMMFVSNISFYMISYL